MKRAVFINNEGKILFLLVPGVLKTNGYMLSLPPVSEVNDTCVRMFSNSLHLLYGISIDMDKYPYRHDQYTRIYKMCDEYRVIPVNVSTTYGSKFPLVWLNKDDIRNMRAVNTSMLFDNYSVIEEVFHALA